MFTRLLRNNDSNISGRMWYIQTAFTGFQEYRLYIRECWKRINCLNKYLI